MTTSPAVAAIDTMVQELRLEHRRRAFVDGLAHVVSAPGRIPDAPPVTFGVEDRNRLREIADEVVEAIAGTTRSRSRSRTPAARSSQP